MTDDKNRCFWEYFLEMISESKRDIIIYDADKITADTILKELNIPANSVIGNVILNSSGIKIDNWIRIVGSGDNVSRRNLLSWHNDNEVIKSKGLLPIADDVIGGIFALNIGGYKGINGTIWYFAPDT